MNDRELLELIAAQVGALTTNVDSLNINVNSLTKDMSEMKEEFKGVNDKLDRLNSRVTIIEQDHGKKLDVLFDGYKQNAEKIDKIEDISNELKEFREETSNNFTKLNHYTHDVDSKNADRHFDFVRELKDIKHSVNRIEINTAENWRDIARLKATRKYKTK